MKNRLIILILLSICLKVSSQNIEILKKFNGNYFLMKPERSVQPGKQSTSNKNLEVGSYGNAVLLGTSECDKCTPAVFTFKIEESNKLGKPVFFNSMGLYMIPYDKESFIYVMPSEKLGGNWNTIAFSNFYSKNKGKVSSMTDKKLFSYIKSIAEEFKNN